VTEDADRPRQTEFIEPSYKGVLLASLPRQCSRGEFGCGETEGRL